jgi:hypothetical protein
VRACLFVDYLFKNCAENFSKDKLQTLRRGKYDCHVSVLINPAPNTGRGTVGVGAFLCCK